MPEVEVPELGTSVFKLPGEIVKNTEDRLVVLNSVAKSVIDSCRGDHPKYVFTWKRGPKQTSAFEVNEQFSLAKWKGSSGQKL